MTLGDILKTKGSNVYTIHPEATIEQAIQELTQHNIGALVVCDRDICEGEKICGIITERDILRFVADPSRQASSVKVSEVMTRQLYTGEPNQFVEEAMSLMTSRRIRHLPVLSGGRLVGIVSIGDVVKSQLDRLAMENQFMKDYIQG